jgi:hypothetical protein
MAFGSTGSAGTADIEFTASTGPAKTGIEELRATFATATAGMSDDALKLQAAQERADNAIIRSHGRVTSSTLAAELNLRKVVAANEDVAVSAEATGGALRTEASEIERVGRGAAVGSGLVRGLGRAAAFSSTAFLGGAGLVYAIRTTIKAQQDHQSALAQEAAALKAAGLDYGEYKDTIDTTLSSLEELSGFSEDDTVAAFTKLVRATGDVGKALKLVDTSSKIARGSGNDLSSVANAVAKAYDGQTASLRRLVPSLKAGVSGEQAVAQASRQYAGALQANADTAAGAQERLSLAIHKTEVTIGTGLAPVVQTLSNRLTEYLDKANNQKKIQDDVNTAVQDGEKVVKGLADAEKLLAPPIHTAITALGGLEHAVEAAFILGAVAKARKAAVGIGLLQSASIRARTQIVADAAVEERALAGVATQAAETSTVVSRVGAYTGTGAAAGAAGVAAGSDTSILKKYGARVGGPLALAAILASSDLPSGGAAGGVKANVQSAATYALIGTLVGGPLGGVAGAAGYEITKGGEALSNFLGKNFGKYGVGNSNPKLTPAQIKAMSVAVATPGAVSYDQITKLKELSQPPWNAISPQVYNALFKLWRDANAYGPPVPASIATGNAHQPPASTQVNDQGVKTSAYILTPAQRRAIGQSGTQTLSSLGAEDAYDTRAITSLKKRFAEGKVKAKIYASTLIALQNDQASTESQIESIDQAAAAKRTAAANKRAEAGRKAAAKEKEAADKAAAARRKAAAEAKAAAEKRQREYVSSLSTRASTLGDAATVELRHQIAGVGTQVVNGKVVKTSGDAYQEPTAEKKLIAFLKKESTDQKLTASERERYHHLYIAQLSDEAKDEDDFNKKVATILKAAQKKQADALKLRQSIQDQTLANRLAAAQLAETKAGTNTSGVKKAEIAEIAAYQAQLKVEEQRASKLKGLAKLQAISEELQTKDAIAALQNQIKAGSASSANATAQNEQQFLSSAQAIIGSYAPNFAEGKSATRLYELVHETRKTNAHLNEIKKSSKFPGTYGSKLAMEAALG